jgi:hypothetical protein
MNRIQRPCIVCCGGGYSECIWYEKCPHCVGGINKRCAICNGTGLIKFISKRICDYCKGKGYVYI